MLLTNMALTSGTVSKKAPRGMIWVISNVIIMNQAIDTNTVILKSAFYDQNDLPDVLSLQNADNILAYNPILAGNQQYLDLDETTKYLSLGKQLTASVNVEIFVFGKLVKATRTQLLIEWFRKAR